MSSWLSKGSKELQMAKMETEILADMFSKMTNSCDKKCVVKYNDGELQVGEMQCIDRCVGKYLESQDKIGKVLAKFEEQLQQQQNVGIKRYEPLSKN